MFFTKEIETYDIMIILIKGAFFITIIYFSINKFLKTSSFDYTMDQIKPLFKQKV